MAKAAVSVNTFFFQFVCSDGLTLGHQDKSGVGDAGVGRLKLPGEMGKRKVVCREHCLKACHFQRSCLQECCRRGGTMAAHWDVYPFVGRVFSQCYR